MPPMDTIADRIRWILETRDLSARALSKRAGLADGHVSMILRGLVGKGVTAETLAQIARAGGVSVQWLATGEGQRETDLPSIDDDPAPDAGDTTPPETAEREEMPETLGQRRGYATQEAAAKKELARRNESVEEWVWPHVRAANNFTLANTAPSVVMLVELAKFIAAHGDPGVRPKK